MQIFEIKEAKLMMVLLQLLTLSQFEYCSVLTVPFKEEEITKLLCTVVVFKELEEYLKYCKCFKKLRLFSGIERSYVPNMYIEDS